MKFVLCVAVLVKLGFHMQEAYMLNQEINNTGINNKFESNMNENDSFIKFDTEYLIIYFIILQNIMIIFI